ncbi:MAG: DUF6514 family protein [Oscillospiraceae bacterium]|nr:DUF6514 family protein [Oscillospiraceae bacterium]
MVTYRVIGKLVNDDSCKGVCSYSIIALDSDGRNVAEVDDISVNREEVTGLAETMNRNSLSLVHFKDVIEDFLCLKY